MNLKKDFLANYLAVAPAALAIERVMECEILSTKKFSRPVLDVGCGDGLFALTFFDEPIDVGVDPNSKELERAGRTGMYIRLLNCYGDNIPLPGHSFNTIFTNSVLEHIEGIENVLTELRRLLTEDGNLYITVPTEKFDQYNIAYQFFRFIGLNELAKQYQSFFNRFWVHYHHYTIEEWIQIFQQNGFVVHSYQEYGNKSVCLLNDALVPFALNNFVIRKYLNRWFIFPSLRKITASFYYPIFKQLLRLLRRESPQDCGGLVFFALRKV